MRYPRLAVAALLASVVALAAPLNREVLVDTTSTTITRSSHATAVELQNLGSEPIYCVLGSDAATTTNGRRIDAAGGTWAIHTSLPVQCIATTAKQTAGAGTRVTELQ